MKKEINKTLGQHINKKIILSVSGGIDSLVLFDLLKNLGFNFVVAHFNHQQRKQSKTEASYIEKLCEKNNITYEYFILNIDQTKNFQSEASRLRKKHLMEAAKKHQTDVIVTAHQLDDLAETVILKLSRGSNLLGYAGMQQSYFKYGIHFVKPLLYIKKEEIIQYAKQNNIKFFEDETNISTLYTRNKIRHEIIPLLIEENPSFLKKIIEYNKNLSKSFNYIRKTTTSFLNNKDFFSISEFKKLDEAIQHDIIAYLLENKDINITLNKLEMIVDFLLTSKPNASITLEKDLFFKKEYDLAFISKKEVPIIFKQKLFLTKENVLPNNDVIIFNNINNDFVNKNDILWYNKMVLPLYARTRENGDLLFFDYGHKKLKDFYIDQKVPLRERNSDIIIVDSNNQILAVIGRYYNRNPKLKDKIIIEHRRKQNEI